MKKGILIVLSAGLSIFAAGAFRFFDSLSEVSAREPATFVAVPKPTAVPVTNRLFQIDVLVGGRPLEEYSARGKYYIEAIQGAEYELRIYNPLSVRVAVALSVDGLNSIDARHTTAWNASKWVIGPYQTIYISGWQMSSDRARRFYFTTERDSYGAKLGETANLGVISAVFFRERRSIPVPVIPPPRPSSPPYEDDRVREEAQSSDSRRPASPSGNAGAEKGRRADVAPLPDDESAATGIGRSVRNDVHWINMELESQPASEITIRYEYYPALVRLGILPRPYSRPDSLKRREGAAGFEDRRYSPEP